MQQQLRLAGRIERQLRRQLGRQQRGLERGLERGLLVVGLETLVGRRVRRHVGTAAG
jgi:hypothetical protein